ncbi:hypothetical protein EG856_01885 [Mycoplasmopsis phocirhinis]|uniref:DUF31 domain-containing protein n=1 Tax=Mycoplasmopsis phocirhinis TaxID=142650 RepID=A0A4P6MTJ1_9BACT|nr:DUF31 family protein [Mycoplasmopsis phocirhinis]QBF34667.1 hypothetical protein EG856_01885 [Mycoplasmopsis phocirhinis]
MKKTKLIIGLSSASLILPLSVVSCQQNKQSDQNKTPEKPKTNTSSSKTKTRTNLDKIASKQFDELFSVEFKDISGRTVTKDEISVDGVQRNSLQNVNLKVKPNFSNQVNAKLINIGGNWDKQRTGKAHFSIQFIDKNDEKNTKIHTYIISGFKSNQFNANDDGTIIADPRLSIVDDFQEYENANQEQRFKIDNKDYIEGLKRQYQDTDITKLRPELNYTQQAAEKFNTLSQEAKLNSYEDSVYKGYTLPTFNDKGEIDALSIHGKDAPALYSKIDFLGDRDPNQSIGLARLLPNEKYKQIALETMAISFTSKEDFAREIKQAEQMIEKLKTWNQSTPEFMSYINNLVEKENLEKTYLSNLLAGELRTAYERDVDGIKKRYQDAQDEIDKKIETIKAYTTNDVIKQYEQKIQEYKSDAASGKKFNGSTGTMWIMDYEIPQDGKYPTKWYFGTNSHVAKLMSSKNFSGFSINVLDDSINVNTKLRLNGLDTHFNEFVFGGPQVQNILTKIFDATDYLSTSPKDYLTQQQQNEYEGVEEMIDFAVLELDLSKFNFNEGYDLSVISNKIAKDNTFGGSVENLARALTNNYFDRKPEDKVKFLSTSYLKDYDKIDYQLRVKEGETPKQTDELFALGYPSSRDDFFLRRYEDEDQFLQKNYYQSLWVNSDYRFYYAENNNEDGPANFLKSRLDKGNYLSYQIGYRSFIDKPGINDAFIVSPLRGNKIYETYDEDKTTIRKYFNTGLQYMLRHFAPIGGSSGSSVRNQKNELVAVHSSIIPSARTDFAAAFRSEGYDYKGAYGKYNLEQYDLIYGGGKNQKKSYLDSLIKKYNENGIKTYLFQNGASKNNIPDEFKFKNNEQ